MSAVEHYDSPNCDCVDRDEHDMEVERLKLALKQIVRGWEVGLSAGDLHDIAATALESETKQPEQ